MKNYCVKFDNVCHYATSTGECSASVCTLFDGTPLTNPKERVVHTAELNREINLEDGIYVQFFAVSDGIRYDRRTINMGDLSKYLTNGLMDGLENAVFGDVKK